MIAQFKTITDLNLVIKEYEERLRLRPTRKYSHPTLYRKRDVGKNEILYKGVRDGDWFFSENKEWVLPHDQMGLSFSSTFKNLKDVYRLKGKWNPGAQIDVHWVMERPDLPDGMKFVADRDKIGHYFLTVTGPMILPTLIKKLKILARQMSIIRGCK
jgi:hypothetical protein